MNILILVKNSGIGGVASCTKSLAEGLRKKNVNVVIGISKGAGIDFMLKDEKIEVVPFESKNFISVYQRISQIIKEYQIDVIHAQNRIPALYACFYCALHRKVKYIWANHIVPLPHDFIHRFLTRYGSCAVAESIVGQKMLIEDFRIPEEKVKVVNLGSNIDSFKKLSDAECTKLREKFGIQVNDVVLFLYGRLSSEKGHLFLLDTLNELSMSKNIPQFKLIFPGGGGKTIRE